MARINIEDELHADQRFKRLVRKLGDEDRALGMLIRFWTLAQKHWGDEMALVPFEEFELGDFEPILEAGLAERRKSGIYCKGSEQRFAWYLQKCRAGRARGKGDRNDAGQFTSGSPPETDSAGRNSSGSPAAPDSVPASSPAPAPVPAPVLALVQNTKTKTKKEVAHAPSPSGKSPRKSRFSEPTRQKMRGFFESYAKHYQEKYGGPPLELTDSQIIGKVGNWIENVAEDRARELIQVYLQIDHKPVNDSCHSLQFFLWNLNRIGVALNRGQDPSGIDWSRVFGNSA